MNLGDGISLSVSCCQVRSVGTIRICAADTGRSNGLTKARLCSRHCGEYNERLTPLGCTTPHCSWPVASADTTEKEIASSQRLRDTSLDRHCMTCLVGGLDSIALTANADRHGIVPAGDRILYEANTSGPETLLPKAVAEILTPSRSIIILARLGSSPRDDYLVRWVPSYGVLSLGGLRDEPHVTGFVAGHNLVVPIPERKITNLGSFAPQSGNLK